MKIVNCKVQSELHETATVIPAGFSFVFSIANFAMLTLQFEMTNLL